MYVGDIPVLCDRKNCQFQASLNPSVRSLPNDGITTIRLREIVYDIITAEIVELAFRRAKAF